METYPTLLFHCRRHCIVAKDLIITTQANPGLHLFSLQEHLAIMWNGVSGMLVVVLVK